MARVVVVGSGVAGLVTALVANREHEVEIVTKAALAESATRAAQGGIAAAWRADDDPAAHAADTIAAGAGLCDPAAVRILCEEGPAAIRALIEWGTAFDRTPDGTALAAGLEAAHGRPRILHAGGDATGAEIERALVGAVRAAGIPVREHASLVDLVVEAGAVSGVDLVDATGARSRLAADAVVLATGGFGRLFRHTSNPDVATGDGLAAAIRAGAETADLEFVQFHPTTLALPGAFLVSEAVRGEGAVLRDVHGHRFMPDVHPDAELAPRDVVARAIARTMAAQGGLPVHLDARAIGRDRLAERFPTITARCAEQGLSLADDLVPVAPAAHYAMGGVATDLDGRTSLPGLVAVGEVACTGVHGANRLASNSLLEGVVFGARAARAIGDPWREAAASPAPVAFASVALDRDDLRDRTQAGAGLERDADGLAALATHLDAVATAPGRPVDRAAVEDAALVEVGRAVVAAALAREESRGAHFRIDHPRTDAVAVRRITTRQEVRPC